MPVREFNLIACPLAENSLPYLDFKVGESPQPIRPAGTDVAYSVV